MEQEVKMVRLVPCERCKGMGNEWVATKSGVALLDCHICGASGYVAVAIEPGEFKEGEE